MDSKFKQGDICLLINVQSKYPQYNNTRVIIDTVKSMGAYYTFWFNYAVLTEVDNVLLSDIDECQLQSIAVLDIPEIWPPKCTCSIQQLAAAGCDCGAMKKEREMRAKFNDDFKATFIEKI